MLYIDMTKIADLIRGDVDLITLSEFRDETRVIHELMDDGFGIVGSRINALSNRISALSTDIIRLETIMRNFVSRDRGEGENHE